MTSISMNIEGAAREPRTMKREERVPEDSRGGNLDQGIDINSPNEGP